MIGLIIGITSIVAWLIWTNAFYQVREGFALIRWGLGGDKAYFRGSFFAYPFVHRVEKINIKEQRVLISLVGDQNVWTQDRIRVDIQLTFFVQIRLSNWDVLQVAKRFGGAHATDKAILKKVFEPKLVPVLKKLIHQYTYQDLHEAPNKLIRALKQALELEGQLLDSNGDSGAAGQTLTSTVTGTDWTSDNNNWSLSGNSITSTNFIGTTNSQPFNIKVNNNSFGSFHPNGGINLGNTSIANVNQAIAIGDGASANSNEAIAIGDSAKADFYQAIAIGVNSVSSKNETIAVGKDSKADGYQSIAIGVNSETNNNDAIAIGNTAKASSYQSIAIGVNSETSNNQAIAIGNTAKASNQQAIAIGKDTNVSGQNATGIGYQATTAQANAIVLGSSANNNNKVGIGTNTPEVPLHVVDGSDASLSDGSGQLLLGELNGDNLVLDKNEIQARDNGEASILFLQQNGGDVYVGNAIVHASDRRLKRDINDISYGLKDILKLRPTEYFWKGRTQEHKSLGLIAQEVDEVIENVVTYDKKQDKYGVSYTELIPVLIKALQEQQEVINTLQSNQQNQLDTISELKAEVSKMKTSN